MNHLTVEQRGDLAEAMLPVAANLSVIVHGDGGPEDVADQLAALNDIQKNALIVVLAGLVDPGQPLTQLLGWIPDMLQNTPPASDETLRTIAEDPGHHCVTCTCANPATEYVDPVVIEEFLAGKRPTMTRNERVAAILEGQRRGLPLKVMDALAGSEPGTTDRFLSRTRRNAEAGTTPIEPRKPLSDEQVIQIREKSAAGETDVDIAMSFGVSKATVGRIVRGEHYANVGGPIRTTKRPVGSANTASKDFFASGLGSDSSLIIPNQIRGRSSDCAIPTQTSGRRAA